MAQRHESPKDASDQIDRIVTKLHARRANLLQRLRDNDLGPYVEPSADSFNIDGTNKYVEEMFPVEEYKLENPDGDVYDSRPQLSMGKHEDGDKTSLLVLSGHKVIVSGKDPSSAIPGDKEFVEYDDVGLARKAASKILRNIRADTVPTEKKVAEIELDKAKVKAAREERAAKRLGTLLS